MGIQGIEVHAVNRFARRISNTSRIDNELWVVMPRGCILQSPLATRIGVARAEVFLARIHQPWIGEGACGCSSYQHLRRLLRVGTSVLVATCGCQHEFAKQFWLLLDF